MTCQSITTLPVFFYSGKFFFVIWKIKKCLKKSIFENTNVRIKIYVRKMRYVRKELCVYYLVINSVIVNIGHQYSILSCSAIRHKTKEHHNLLKHFYSAQLLSKHRVKRLRASEPYHDIGSQCS